MIWVHCGDANCVSSTQSLIARLSQQMPDTSVLVTADPSVLDMLQPLPKMVEAEALPADTPHRVHVFLEDWKPDHLIWNGGTLRPVLLRYVHRADLPATLINANVSGILGNGAGWLPRATRNAVKAFDRILTKDGATATRLRRGGVPSERVEATGPILEDTLPLPYNSNEYTVMAEAVGSRPVWLAANVSAAEITHLAKAHLAASRKSHRMMMILTPSDIDSGPQVAEVLRDAGLHTGIRSEGDDPLPDMQAYIADLPDELGLWYRIAPLTFIGGTLRAGKVASPYDPIILGSAVVHGTRKYPHETRFERLASVEASREIRSAAELGIAIATLSSPEQCARMSLAGWEELTRSADIINGLVQHAQDCVDLARGTP